MRKPTISPMLSVRRGAEAVEFYKKAFGASELFMIKSPDGAVVAQLAVGEADFWAADESPEHQNFSPESLSGSTVRMVVVVENPDALFNQAVAAGAKVVSPMEDHATAGAWAVSPIPMDTTGRLASRCSKCSVVPSAQFEFPDADRQFPLRTVVSRKS